MCPLFEDHDSIRSKCSNSQPCHSTEPTIIQLDDYGYTYSNDDIPCNQCEEVMNKNPSLFEKCLKVQKYGLPSKNSKKVCEKTKLEFDSEESLRFYKDKEYHFWNCFICGWGEAEKNLTEERRL